MSDRLLLSERFCLFGHVLLDCLFGSLLGRDNRFRSLG